MILVEHEDRAFINSISSDVKSISPNENIKIQATQNQPPWGLDRIDKRNGLDSTFNYDSTGLGVTIYILDTGIRSNHTQFGGRVRSGYSPIGGTTEDCNGHGTHVAGIAAGTTYGVAKLATLVPIRAMACDGAGSMDAILAGINWMIGVARGPSVLNMSLGGSRYTALNEAVERAAARGIVSAVAAGNFGDDACAYSPASTLSALTVAASDVNDLAARFSAWGACVDIYAPGVDIVSASARDDYESMIMSGTSMATPFAAGALALLLEREPSLSPAQVIARLIANSSSNVIRGAPGGTPPRLLFTAKAYTNDEPDRVPAEPPTDKSNLPDECEKNRDACDYYVGKLDASKTYDQQPSNLGGWIMVDAPRRIDISIRAMSDVDIYLFYPADGGNWTMIEESKADGQYERLTTNVERPGYYSWMVVLRNPVESISFEQWFVR
jgi:subtilisin family serine protease